MYQQFVGYAEGFDDDDDTVDGTATVVKNDADINSQVSGDDDPDAEITI
jgi:hypothetical protein